MKLRVGDLARLAGPGRVAKTWTTSIYCTFARKSDDDRGLVSSDELLIVLSFDDDNYAARILSSSGSVGWLYTDELELVSR